MEAKQNRLSKVVFGISVIIIKVYNIINGVWHENKHLYINNIFLTLQQAIIYYVYLHILIFFKEAYTSNFFLVSNFIIYFKIKSSEDFLGSMIFLCSLKIGIIIYSVFILTYTILKIYLKVRKFKITHYISTIYWSEYH